MKKFIFKTTLLAAALAPVASNAALLLKADMEVSGIASYAWERSGNAPIIGSHGISCDGTKSMRVDLDYYNSPTNFRTEVTNIKFEGDEHFQFGRTYWLGFALYIPSSPGLDSQYGEILMQFQAPPDSGETWRHPPVALIVDKGKFVLSINADNRSITPYGKYQTIKNIPVGDATTNQWINVAMQFKVSYGSDGFVHTWINGKKTEYFGPMTFNDKIGPYLKLGTYKPGWKDGALWAGKPIKSTRKHFVDSLKIGNATSSLSEVSTTCTTNLLEPNPPSNVLLK